MDILRAGLLSATIFVASTAHSQSYKRMMDDFSINFYTVCDSADAYFETHAKGKGSGYKGYQRWRYKNEGYYAPTGDRSIELGETFQKRHQNFLRSNFPEELERSMHRGAGAVWQELGPSNADNVTTSWSPGIGRIEDFWVDPDNANLIYLCSRSGGFWRSSDGGATWLNTTDNLTATGCNTIAVDPQNNDHILINLQYARTENSLGVYESLDGGLTWATTILSPDGAEQFGGLNNSNEIREIAFHPTVPNLIFVASNLGLYRSVDGLATVALQPIFDGHDEIEFHPTDADKMYVLEHDFFNRDRMQISIDQGLTWTDSGIFEGNNSYYFKITVSDAEPNSIWIASDSGIWKSADQGATFTAIEVGLDDDRVDGFVVSHDNADVWFSGYLNTFKTLDGGTTIVEATNWNVDVAGFGDQYIHADLRKARYIGGAFYVATDGYLCKSTDTLASWSRLSNGVGTRELYEVGIAQGNVDFYGSGAQDNGTSIHTASGWKEFLGADGFEVLFHPTNTNFIMGSSQNGSRYRSFDGAESYSNVTIAGDTADWNAPMVADPNNPFAIMHAGQNAYRTENFGGEWDLRSDLNFTFPAEVMKASTLNSNFLAIGNRDVLYVSQDTAATIDPITENVDNGFISDFAIAPDQDSTIVLGSSTASVTENRLFMTSDMGTTWQNITYNLSHMPVRCIEIENSAPRTIYLGTEVSIYYMEEGGDNWTPYNVDLPNVAVEDLQINHGSNTLVIATWGRGVWCASLVGKDDFPSIASVQTSVPVTMEGPNNLEEMYIAARIEYAGNLAATTLKWGTDNQALENEIDMVLQEDGSYRSAAPIVNEPFGARIFYRVETTSTTGQHTETARFVYETYEAALCEAEGGPFSEEYLIYVEINETGFESDQEFYLDNTAEAVEVERGSELFIGLETDGIDEGYGASAWIDWNKNFNFEAEERFDFDEFINGFNEGYLDIPADAPLGEVRMRIVQFDNFEDAEPCGTVDGEVEDYMLDIVEEAVVLDYAGFNQACVGQLFEVEYDGSDMDAVNWTFVNEAGTTVVFEGEALEISLEEAGEYTLTLTGTRDDENFEAEFVGEFEIFANPALEIQASSTAVCENGEVTLTAIDTDDDDDSTAYTWENEVVENGVAFTPNTTATYIVEAQNDDGCTASAQLEIVVSEELLVTIDASTMAVCMGDMLTLTATGAAEINWENNIENGVAFTPTENTTYTVNGTNGEGCEGTATVAIVVNDLPEITVSATENSVCEGESTTLSAEGANTVVWSNAVENNVPFAPTATATYEASGTDENGCTSSTSIEIELKPNPELNLETSDDMPCAGSEITLNSTSTGLVTWNGAVENGVAFTLENTTEFSATALAQNGCETTETITITAMDSPVLEIVASDEAICTNQPVTLTASGAEVFAWDNGVQNGVAFTPTATTTYTVSSTADNGCVGSASVTVFVTEGELDITPLASSTAVCAGESVNLSASGASTYTWSDGVENDVDFVPTATATYTVNGQNSFGCMGSAMIEIEVNPIPNIMVNATQEMLCAGETTSLSAMGDGTIVWSDDVQDGADFTPQNTTTYTATATNADGCSNTASMEITVFPLPEIEAQSADADVCLGEQTNLFATGGASYVWSDGVSNGQFFTPIENTTYTVIGTDANGCVGESEITITVNPFPTVVAQSSTENVCLGSSVTLTGSGADFYSWSGNVTDGEAFSPATTQTYTLTGTTEFGCEGTTTIILPVFPLPQVSATASPSSLCLGESTTLSGSGALSYVWSGGVQNGEAFEPQESGIYSVTGISAQGCENTFALQITVNTVPELIFELPNLTACQGEEITLFAAGAANVEWSGTVDNGVPFEIEETTEYTVIITTPNGCSDSETFTIEVTEIDNTIFSNLALLQTTNAAATYQWGLCDENEEFEPIEGATSQTYTALENGDYAVLLTQDGCTIMSDCETILSINIAEEVAQSLSLFPNPATDFVTIDFGNTPGRSSLKIYSAQGKCVGEYENINAPQFEIDTRDLSAGIYTLQVVKNGQLIRLKMEVMH